MTQDRFDLTIGRLDRILSELMVYSKAEMDEPNKQTLKHHAEDMEACAKSILSILNTKERACIADIVRVLPSAQWTHMRDGSVQFYSDNVPMFSIDFMKMWKDEAIAIAEKHKHQSEQPSRLAS